LFLLERHLASLYRPIVTEALLDPLLRDISVGVQGTLIALTLDEPGVRIYIG
jgi:hypothetical protein